MEKVNKDLLEEMKEKFYRVMPEEKERNERIERVLEEKGIDGLTRREREIAEHYLNYEPTFFDKELYKNRNQVERLFRHIKDFRRVFTRFDNLDIMFISFVQLVLLFIPLK